MTQDIPSRQVKILVANPFFWLLLDDLEIKGVFIDEACAGSADEAVVSVGA